MSGPTPSTEVLTRSEAAERLKISVSTLDRYVRRGLVPRVKIDGRVLFVWQDAFAAFRSMMTTDTVANEIAGGEA